MPAPNPVASPPVVTSLLPENVVDDVLDYEDDLVEQSCVGATPTLDERPEPVTTGKPETCDDPVPSSPSLTSISASASTERLLLEIKTAVDANTDALRRQEAALLELANTVRDLSQSLVDAEKNNGNNKRKTEDRQTDRRLTPEKTNKRSTEDEQERGDRKDRRYHDNRRDRGHSHHKDRRDTH